MSITDFVDMPAALACLLQWPAKLEELSFYRFCGTGVELNICHIASWLGKHSTSLKKLRIRGTVRYVSSIWPDFSAFTALRDLTTSPWGMSRSLDFSEENAALFLPPNVEKFTWCFEKDTEVYHGDFSDRDEKWLGVLLRIAIKKKTQLKEVYINFNPTDEPWNEFVQDLSHHYRQPTKYAWDRLDNLKRAFEPQGIILTYSNPTISRDNWITARANERAEGNSRSLSFLN